LVTRIIAGTARGRRLQVPAGVGTVLVEGRDQVNGWGGGTQTVELPA